MTDRLRQDLAALNALNWSLSQSLELDEISGLAVEAALRAVDSQAGGLYVLSNDRPDVFQLRAHLALTDAFVRENDTIPGHDPDVQKAINSGGPTILERYSNTGTTGETRDSTPDTQQWACFPLLAHNRLQGLMVVQVSELEADQALLMRTIGHHIGIAIENARLYQQSKQDASRLRRETERWLALNRAALAASGVHSEQEVYDTITHTLSEIGFTCGIGSPEAKEHDGRGGSRGPSYTIFSAATPHPTLLKAIKRLIGQPVIGSRFSIKQIIPQSHSSLNEARFLHLGTEKVAKALGLDDTGLVCGIERRIGLEYGIAAPLRSGNKTVAVLLVMGDDLIPEDVPVISSFASQASIAIENACLIEAERRQREEAEMLSDLVITVNSTLDLDQVLDLAVHRLQILHQATACSVSFLEEDGQTLIFKATTDRSLRISEGVTFPTEKSVAGRALRERRVQIDNDLSHAPDYQEVITRRSGILAHSLLTAPLFADDTPLGVIQVLSARPNAFSQSDAQMLSITAALVETAVARARAYEEAVELAEAERRQREVAERLRRVAAILNATLNLETVLSRILEQLRHVVEFDSSSVLLLEQNELIVKSALGLPEYLSVVGTRIPIESNDPSSRVFNTRQPLILADAQADPGWLPITGTEYIRGWMGVPLIVGNRAIGIVTLDRSQVGPFSERDAQLVRIFADQAATAIENARLHQALRDYTAELETRVETRTTEVNQERERLLTVLENAGGGIVITNAEGVIEYANPAWEQLTGRNAVHAIQQKANIVDKTMFPDVFANKHSDRHQVPVNRREITDTRPDGTAYTSDMAVTPIFSDAGNMVSLVVVYRDITEFKEIDRIKSQFLNTAAHQLRTPLTTLLGFSELLLTRPQLTYSERELFLRRINERAQHLKELVEDLLDISQFESGGKSVVDLHPTALHPILKREIRSWQNTNPDHTYVLKPDINHIEVFADEERLVRQVIRNLLSNATKYSPQGSKISVEISLVGRYAEVTIADEGIGMTPEEIRRVFDKFWRADTSSTAVEGTGLGLVVARYVLEQHGGQIWIESTQGKGTAVHFTLPRTEHQTTVLIVEDEEAVREIEQHALASEGLATLTASNGPEAIDLALVHRPDLILLDLMMPGMSGLDVLLALKSNPATVHIPVVVVSARSGWQVIEETYNLGAIDFVSKPFEYDELLSRVRGALMAAARPLFRSGPCVTPETSHTTSAGTQKNRGPYPTRQ